MLKRCPNCNNLLWYNSYFKQFYCSKCGTLLPFKNISQSETDSFISKIEEKEIPYEDLINRLGMPVYLPEIFAWVLVEKNQSDCIIFTFPLGEICSAKDWYDNVGPAYSFFDNLNNDIIKTITDKDRKEFNNEL